MAFNRDQLLKLLKQASQDAKAQQALKVDLFREQALAMSRAYLNAENARVQAQLQNLNTNTPLIEQFQFQQQQAQQALGRGLSQIPEGPFFGPPDPYLEWGSGRSVEQAVLDALKQIPGLFGVDSPIRFSPVLASSDEFRRGFLSALGLLLELLNIQRGGAVLAEIEAACTPLLVQPDAAARAVTRRIALED